MADHLHRRAGEGSFKGKNAAENRGAPKGGKADSGVAMNYFDGNKEKSSLGAGTPAQPLWKICLLIYLGDAGGDHHKSAYARRGLREPLRGGSL